MGDHWALQQELIEVKKIRDALQGDNKVLLQQIEGMEQELVAKGQQIEDSEKKIDSLKQQLAEQKKEYDDSRDVILELRCSLADALGDERDIEDLMASLDAQSSSEEASSDDSDDEEEDDDDGEDEDEDDEEEDGDVEEEEDGDVEEEEEEEEENKEQEEEEQDEVKEMEDIAENLGILTGIRTDVKLYGYKSHISVWRDIKQMVDIPEAESIAMIDNLSCSKARNIKSKIRSTGKVQSKKEMIEGIKAKIHVLRVNKQNT